MSKDNKRRRSILYIQSLAIIILTLWGTFIIAHFSDQDVGVFSYVYLVSGIIIWVYHLVYHGDES